MKHLMTLLLLLTWAQAGLAQEPQEDSFFAEKEDSISALAIKPVKKPYKLLKKVIKQLQLDSKQRPDVCKYNINATFRRETLESFSVNRSVTAEVGIDLKREDVKKTREFCYTGPYELHRQDSIFIRGYLNQFALLSPNHVPYMNAVLVGKTSPYPSFRSLGIYLGEVLYPLKKYNTTSYYYNVTAYSIDDASGRGTYRLHFVRNREKHVVKYAGKVYDLGEVTGTAYFDSHTLHIMQFKGKARLLSHQHVVHLRYLIDYDTTGDTPVLRRIRLIWEAGGTVIEATVEKI